MAEAGVNVSQCQADWRRRRGLGSWHFSGSLGVLGSQVTQLEVAVARGLCQGGRLSPGVELLKANWDCTVW